MRWPLRMGLVALDNVIPNCNSIPMARHTITKTQKERLESRLRDSSSKTRLTDADIQRLLAMAAAGTTSTQIALEFGISQGTVSYHIRKACRG